MLLNATESESALRLLDAHVLPGSPVTPRTNFFHYSTTNVKRV